MPVMTIVVEITDEAWAGEMSGEMWGEKWESTPEAVLSDAINYMSGWRMDDDFTYSGSVDLGESP